MIEDPRPDGRSLEEAAACPGVVLAESWDSSSQALRVGGTLERLASFAREGFGMEDTDFIAAEIAAAFVHSNLPDGSDPSVPLLHLQRSALRLLSGRCVKRARRWGTRPWIWCYRLDRRWLLARSLTTRSPCVEGKRCGR